MYSSARPDRILPQAACPPHGNGRETTARVIQLPVQRQEIRQLTSRELQVLELNANGLATADIAKQLSVSEATFLAEETVKSYERCLTVKLHARSMTHAVAIAMHLRLIHLHA